ncbi:unnamed protein product [Alopecurus aequalis]
MCDYFLQRVEGDQQAGDLTDVVRAGGAMPVGATGLPSTATEWLQHPTGPILLQPPQSSSDGSRASGADAFGDPFSGLLDPFSSDYPSSSGSAAADFFDAVKDAMDMGMAKQVGFFDAAGCGGAVAGGRMLDMRNHSMFPREMPMPVVSPRAIGPYAAMGCGAPKLGVPIAAHGQAAGPPCGFDAAAGLHMSSSPRASGIKRRKNQARKVVCIPATSAAVPGKTTGEVVPSDLWAWRKYGQKPIKGSPYPRGYYRCSSSKGCPARKQVERSRTDPNMLVITYTSEHNHPWPTQRNVLAGSTRSHYAKNTANTAAASSKSNSSRNQQKPSVKGEPKDQASSAARAATTTATTCTGNSTPPTAVKEESEMERNADADDAATVDYHSDHLLRQMFSQSYRPMEPEAEGGYHQHDDFFTDLTELESDPVSLIFSAEYMETIPDKSDKGKAAANKDLDPSFMMGWAPASAVTTSAGSSFEKGERAL